MVSATDCLCASDCLCATDCLCGPACFPPSAFHCSLSWARLGSCFWPKLSAESFLCCERRNERPSVFFRSSLFSLWAQLFASGARLAATMRPREPLFQRQTAEDSLWPPETVSVRTIPSLCLGMGREHLEKRRREE